MDTEWKDCQHTTALENTDIRPSPVALSRKPASITSSTLYHTYSLLAFFFFFKYTKTFRFLNKKQNITKKQKKTPNSEQI